MGKSLKVELHYAKMLIKLFFGFQVQEAEIIKHIRLEKEWMEEVCRDKVGVH